MSPKNKGKFGKGKPTVEQSDEFIDGMTRLGRKLKPYAARIAIVVTIVTVGIIGLTAYKWWEDTNEKEATASYIQGLDIARRRVVTEAEKKEIDDRKANPKLPDPKDPRAPAEPPPEDVYTSTVVRANEALTAFEEVSSATGVGGQARLVRATALLQASKFDEAVASYREYADSGPIPDLKTLALEGIGYAFEGKAMAVQDPSEREAALRLALNAFRKMQPDEEGPRRDYAMFHEARILATLEERAVAIELFEKILELDPPSDLSPKVNNRLAVLKGRGGSAPAASKQDQDDPDPGGDEPEGDEPKPEGDEPK